MTALRRLLPDGLTGRIVLLLAGALIAANVIAFALLTAEQMRSDRKAAASREIERIAALVPAMEAVASPLRQGIARQSSTRFARVRVDPAPLVQVTAAGRLSGQIAAVLQDTLARNDIAVAILDRPPPGQRGDRLRGFFRHGVIAITIPLTPRDGAAQWLNVLTTGEPPGPEQMQQEGFLTVLILSLLSVLGMALLFARRLTEPLKALAAAATAAGRGDRGARVPETGAAEMRAAARAFNAMQGEISRFDAERMRTLAAVGHDLRTPLTSLRIRAEMIDDDDLRAPLIRSLDEMTVMADGLVSFARDGREAEATTLLDLYALLADLCRDRALPFVGEPARVQGRPVGLRRVFGNLIDNALRYGGAARVTLSKAPGQAIVVIDDTGPGIPEERLEDMFKPFTRGDDSRSTETGGAGLGLSIARTIVLSHAGEIRLENLSTGGLRARVTLPLKETRT